MGNAVYRAYEALAGNAGLTFDSGNGVIYGRRNGFDVIIYAADSRYPYLITVSLGAKRAGGGALAKTIGIGLLRNISRYKM